MSIWVQLKYAEHRRKTRLAHTVSKHQYIQKAEPDAKSWYHNQERQEFISHLQLLLITWFSTRSTSDKNIFKKSCNLCNSCCLQNLKKNIYFPHPFLSGMTWYIDCLENYSKDILTFETVAWSSTSWLLTSNITVPFVWKPHNLNLLHYF